MGGLICATMRSGDRRRKEVRPSLKEIADRAAAEAERQAICLAPHATRGNKSEATRLLRVDYKTLHLKTKRYRYRGRGIPGVVTRAEISAKDCA